MNWQDILRTVAPTIATALGGPLAGAGTKFLAEKFLGNSEATEAELSQAIEQATPQDLVKLKELDNQFRIEIRKLETEDFKVEVSDRSNARQRAVDMLKAGAKYSTEDVLAVMTVIFGFGILCVYSVTKSVEAKEIVLLIGALITQVFSYYYGASKKP
jgi:hypothetical protein